MFGQASTKCYGFERIASFNIHVEKYYVFKEINLALAK